VNTQAAPTENSRASAWKYESLQGTQRGPGGRTESGLELKKLDAEPAQAQSAASKHLVDISQESQESPPALSAVSVKQHR
jgi:hypothetical protein